MASTSIKTKEDLAFEIFKIFIDRLPNDELSKETIVDTYNYIYDNIHGLTNDVVIIDDIPRK